MSEREGEKREKREQREEREDGKRARRGFAWLLDTHSKIGRMNELARHGGAYL